MKKILFLYTEIAEYFLACLAELEKQDVEVEVVRWQVNREAPFRFRSLGKTKFHDRNGLDNAALENLATHFQPDVIFCSGWTDKGYNRLCRKWRKEIPTVLLLDNHWTGHWKQHIASMLNTFIVRDKFSHAWIPGKPQLEFVKRLGFDHNNVRTGYYVADTPLFENYFVDALAQKQKQMPRRLFYAGRYLEFKGIFDLWKAFVEISTDFPEWELWCAGTGELWEQRILHPKIFHHGFVQPSQFERLILQTSVFVLPSHKEPWGVVVQEMAAAGMPLVCSHTVGAAMQFLEEGKNGFIYEAGNVGELKKVLQKMMSLNDEELQMMSTHSHTLSKSLSPQTWSETAMAFAADK